MLTSRSPIAAALRILLTLMLGLVLTACATITLVPPYDEQIDTGLTQLYGDTSGFVDKMIGKAGTPAGAYAANTDFYDDAKSRVASLIVRAEAHRVLNDCPSTAIISRAFDKIPLSADVKGEIGTLSKDDCQVQLLRLIERNYDRMAKIHAAGGTAGLPAAAKGQFIDGGVGAMLRAAITVEIAKRASAKEQSK